MKERHRDRRDVRDPLGRVSSGQGHKRCLSPGLRESTGPAGGTRCASSTLPLRRWTSADGVSSKIPWDMGAGAAILYARRASPCPAHRCRPLDFCPGEGVPPDPVHGRHEHLRGRALGFRNLNQLPTPSPPARRQIHPDAPFKHEKSIKCGCLFVSSHRCNVPYFTGSPGGSSAPSVRMTPGLLRFLVADGRDGASWSLA